MRKEQLNDALNALNDDLIADAVSKDMAQKKKARSPYLRVLLIAAAIALIAAAVMIPVFALTAKPDYPVTTPATAATDPTTASTDPVETPGTERLPKVDLVDYSGNFSAVWRDEPKNYEPAPAEGPPIMRLPIYKESGCSILVKVKPGKLTDDAYTIPCCSNGARILSLQVLDVLYGAGIPEEINIAYYPGICEPLLEYDAFYMCLVQICPDNSPFINERTGETEHFPNLFTFADQYRLGTVIAVNDGKIDASLWERKYWQPTSSISDFLTGPYELNLQSGENATDEELREALMKRVPQTENPQMPERTYLTRASYKDVPGAKEAFDYIDSAGFFAAAVEYTRNEEFLVYRRLINGYCTIEVIRIGKDGVTRTEAFTKEDLKDLPDLSQMAKLMESSDSIRHYSWIEDKINIWRQTVTCWYVKSEKGIFGVVKKVTDFHYDDANNELYHDDVYLYCEQGNGFCHWITDREILKNKLGCEQYIENFNYKESDVLC